MEEKRNQQQKHQFINNSVQMLSNLMRFWSRVIFYNLQQYSISVALLLGLPHFFQNRAGANENGHVLGVQLPEFSTTFQ